MKAVENKAAPRQIVCDTLTIMVWELPLHSAFLDKKDMAHSLLLGLAKNGIDGIAWNDKEGKFFIS